MLRENNIAKKYLPLVWIAVSSFGLGAAVQGMLSLGNFWSGMLVTALMILIISGTLYFAWKKAGAGQALAWMMLLAFILRLGYAVFLAWGLPRFGYPEPPQQTGYVFEDAYRRDRNAWALAQSDKPITRAFSDDYEVDQYGGVLALSAFVYRYISPDLHRPILISILAAGAMALSVPFLLAGMKGKINGKALLWAGWILVLYPEGILLGASQMRDPFLILFFTMMFWAAACWMDRRDTTIALAVFALSAICLLLFTFRVGLPMIGVVLLWVWVIESSKFQKRWVKIAGWVLIAAAMLFGLWVMRDWVDAVLHWDTLQTIARSGRVQFQLESVPGWLHFPFLLIYGLLQPVLPAAIAAPAPWIWQSLGIMRALGWYLLFPLLAYVLIRVWHLGPSLKKQWLIVFVLIVWAWIFVASARAGGDQWDNPRYRTIFLPWMSILAGWGLIHARQTKDRWLGRVYAIEGIFLLFFTEWYISRYYPVIPRLNMWLMVGIILLLSLLVVLGGWLWDRQHPRESLTDDK